MSRTLERRVSALATTIGIAVFAPPVGAQGGYTPPPAEVVGPEAGDKQDEQESTVPPPPLPATDDEEEAVDEEAIASQEVDATEVARVATSPVAPAADEAQPSFKLHAVFAGAKALAGYQASEFGFGVAGLAAVEWGPTPSWGLQAETGFVYLAGTKEEPPAGLAELDGGAGAHLALGLRIRPLAKSELLPHPAGPWLSAAFGAAFTGRVVAPILDAFIGYDFELSKVLSLGPTLGYMLVIQTDKEGPRTDNASMGLFGVHGTFDFGAAEPKLEDRDHDGILDKVDKCPDKPEDTDGFEDADGCPELDNDEDTIRDVDDHCPLDPEDMDEFEDENGCPDPDNDQDRVLDAVDKCPMDPEDLDDYQDEDGCPDPDNDLDGIPDLKDLCPNEPETKNGIADNDGCPDEESIRVVGDKIELDQKIHFWTNSDRIRAMSYPVLDKLARFLVTHPEYIKVDIGGHADDRGDEEFNLELSKRRAASIRTFLIERGVGQDRLQSEGYGSSRPLVEGKTEHAWFMNRRVEFVVTRNRVEKANPENGEPPQAEGPAFGQDKNPAEVTP